MLGRAAAAVGAAFAKRSMSSACAPARDSTRAAPSAAEESNLRMSFKIGLRSEAGAGHLVRAHPHAHALRHRDLGGALDSGCFGSDLPDGARAQRIAGRCRRARDAELLRLAH